MLLYRGRRGSTIWFARLCYKSFKNRLQGTPDAFFSALGKTYCLFSLKLSMQKNTIDKKCLLIYKSNTSAPNNLISKITKKANTFFSDYANLEIICLKSPWIMDLKLVSTQDNSQKKICWNKNCPIIKPKSNFWGLFPWEF